MKVIDAQDPQQSGRESQELEGRWPVPEQNSHTLAVAVAAVGTLLLVGGLGGMYSAVRCCATRDRSSYNNFILGQKVREGEGA
jgi:hypothetical protein